jgi:hypothetical protein
MTTQAENLVRRIAADLSDVERALRAHPYAQAFRGDIAATGPTFGMVHFSGSTRLCGETWNWFRQGAEASASWI